MLHFVSCRGVTAGTLIVALATSHVLAADLPIHKAPPPAPPPLWSGFYFGANVGAVINGSSGINTSSGALYNDSVAASSFGIPTFFGAASAAAAAGNASLSGVGVIGGGQVGFNWQFSQNFVVGFEADIQGTTLQNNVSIAGVSVEPVTGIPLNSVAHLQRSLSYLGTVRGRVGYLVAPTLLAFATGGLAFGNPSISLAVSQTASDPNGFVGAATASSNYSNARVGWTVGGGLEWMFMPDWSAKVEYLYYDLGSVSTATVLQGNDLNLGVPLYSSGVRTSNHVSGDVVRLGLNYHFQWFSSATAPVPGKY
jgi:outer membrane immunogenic protein